MRSIPDPGFAGDDGTADPGVTASLRDFELGAATYPATLAMLQDRRVLVPVVAVLGEVAYDDSGLAHDKTSDMATVLLTGEDGRQALLAFSSSAALEQWDPQARPVPVTLRDAARAARHDGAAAVLLDVAGPVTFVVEHDDLDALGEGLVLTGLGAGWGWIRPH